MHLETQIPVAVQQVPDPAVKGPLADSSPSLKLLTFG